MRSSPIGLSVLLPALGLFACDSGPDGGTGAGPTSAGSVATYEQFAEAAANRYCQVLAPCCSTEQKALSPTCAADLRKELEEARRRAPIYDAASGAACIDALATVTCAEEDVGGDACQDALRTQSFRSRQLGQSCSLSSDCAPQAAGDAVCIYMEGDEGACFGLTEGKEGEACDTSPVGNTFRECAAPTQCDFETKLCVRVPEVGEACSKGSCRDGICKNGTCVARAAEGAACEFPSDCESFRCDDKTKLCAKSEEGSGSKYGPACK